MKRFMQVTSAILFVAALCGSARADIVAQWDGPQTFTGAMGEDIKLAPVSIGQEGTIGMQFKADSIGSNRVLWYNCSTATGETHEYRVIIDNSLGNQKVGCYLYNSGSYAVQYETPFSDTTSMHTLKFTWKDDSPTLVTLDGVTASITNEHALAAFTSHADWNRLAYGNFSSRFLGTMQNVVIYDTYNAPYSPVPEPGACVLVLSGLFGILAYAWRKRR